MILNVENIKAGDQVAFFTGYDKSGQFSIKTVERTTKDFVFIQIGDLSWKFRRDGSRVGESYKTERIATIEPGDVEKMETEKENGKRINEIIKNLDSKGFKFVGYTQWYNMEQWEKLDQALK